MTGRFIKVNGNRFFIRTWGSCENPILLMLHGFPEYSGAWEELAKILKFKFHCIAPDQRGYGQSHGPESVNEYQIRYLVDDIKEIILHFGGPVAILGHDWGGTVAYSLASEHPDLVSHLMIINGVHPFIFQKNITEDKAQNAASQYFSLYSIEGFEKVLARNDFNGLVTMLKKSSNIDWLTGTTLDRYKLAWRDEKGIQKMLNWYRNFNVPDPKSIPAELPKALPYPFRILHPHLVIWGINDKFLLPQSCTGLADVCEDLTHIELPDADHWLHHQEPEKIAEIILNWSNQRL